MEFEQLKQFVARHDNFCQATSESDPLATVKSDPLTL